MNQTEQEVFIDYEKVDEKTKAGMDRLFKAPKKNFWLKKRAFDLVVSLLALLILSPFHFSLFTYLFLSTIRTAVRSSVKSASDGTESCSPCTNSAPWSATPRN